MNKTLLLLFTLAVLALPMSSASDLLDPTPDTLGRALGAGLVSITYTVDPNVDSGDVVPLCDDVFDVPQNRSLVGSVLDGCFQPAGPYTNNGGPGDICQPIILILFPENGLPVYATPDETCIEGWQDWISRIISGDDRPSRITLNLQK